MGAPIVLDVNVLVDAILPKNNPAAGPDPMSAYNALLMVNHGDHSSLWLSDHILENVYRTLVNKAGVDENLAAEYTYLLEDMAQETGGAVIDNPPQRAFEAAEHEDNLILDLADYSAAPFLVTSNIKDFPGLYRHSTIVKRPAEFVQAYERTRIARIDAAKNRPSRPGTKSRLDQMKSQIETNSKPGNPAQDAEFSSRVKRIEFLADGVERRLASSSGNSKNLNIRIQGRPIEIAEHEFWELIANNCRATADEARRLHADSGAEVAVNLLEERIGAIESQIKTGLAAVKERDQPSKS